MDFDCQCFYCPLAEIKKGSESDFNESVLSFICGAGLSIQLEWLLKL